MMSLHVLVLSSLKAASADRSPVVGSLLLLDAQGPGRMAGSVGMYAALNSLLSAQFNELRTLLLEDGRSAADGSYILARYNDPSTRPRFRRNEVLLPLADFELW